MIVTTTWSLASEADMHLMMIEADVITSTSLEYPVRVASVCIQSASFNFAFPGRNALVLPTGNFSLKGHLLFREFHGFM